MPHEQPLFFECGGEQLLGIVHQPDGAPLPVGLLLVVGGPQYRIGSHRQFVLLARAMAAAGVPVLRFDYRGMGDSSGAARDFEAIADDIRAAADSFFARQPGLERIVLWGLCDAATANAFYALGDRRVLGQVALNPWVRTSAGEAQAFIQHYYLARLLSRTFWRKVLALKFEPQAAARDFLDKLRQSRRRPQSPSVPDQRPLPQRLREAQLAFTGPTLLILSGQDLTAREYEDRVAESPAWRRWLDDPRVELRRLEAADHTFSRAAWRDQVAAWTRDWILRIAG
jgi:exosortase A-associated hydrolase 1